MTRKTIAAAAATAGVLAVPALASAHVTVHPNVVPEGAFTVLNIRVPNEEDNANTTKLAVQMPPGFGDVVVDPPPGWKVSVKMGKAATPIQTDDGPVNTEVKEVDMTGGSLPPGQFIEFPLSTGIPGKAGDTLTFKAIQTYDNGDVVRWIGPPSDQHPAPRIFVSAKGGLVQDTTGEGAPTTSTSDTSTAAAPAATTTTVVKKESSSKGLAIAALIVGALGLAAGGAALFRKS